MRNLVTAFRARLLTQAAFVALVAGMGAACSANPGRFHEPFITGSTPNQREIITGDAAAQPMPAVVTSEDVTRTDLAPPVNVASAGPAPMPLSGGAANYAWSAAGGRVIRVGPGESLDTLAIRYGVPGNEIAKANGISNPYEVRQGKMLVIPVRVAVAAPAPAALPSPAVADAAPAAAPKLAASGTIHVVEPGETLYSIARSNGTNVAAVAALNGLGPDAAIRVGQSLQMPNGALPATAVTVAYNPKDKLPATVGAPPKPLGSLVVHPGKGTEVASLAPAPAAPAPAAPKAVAPVASIPAPVVADISADEPSANGTSFRWPVRGRIISSFGGKAGGEKNDGINLAVPEGTSVKAAEAGTVIYAGNELPGYGNLILVRHADGWVSAYAHNSDLLVKRGDAVLRGQIIARAGMTGSVTSPQVHFELRRGAKPVNPLDYLAGA